MILIPTGDKTKKRHMVLGSLIKFFINHKLLGISFLSVFIFNKNIFIIYTARKISIRFY